jgi:uncharacterized repeat protein (TIGR01451 family)
VQTFGGVPSTDIPNNTFGWGRIDAFAAYQEAISLAETLELTKVASDAYVAPGGVLTYTLNVTHTLGVTVTHNVMITDVIPANTTFITATWPHSVNGSTVFWSAPDLDVGESHSVQLVVQVDGDATGVISNDNYAVTSDEVATTYGPPVHTPVIAYGLEVHKTASSPYVFAGDWLTYTLSVVNQHPLAEATGLVLTDVVPVNTTFITATLPHSFDGTTVEWYAASIPAAETWEVQLVVQVHEDATGSVENTDYAVYSDQVSTVSGAMVSTPIETLGVILTADSAATAVPGAVVTYTHTLTNSGSITDTYDLSYASSEGWTASVSGPVMLGPGASTEVWIVLTIPTDTISGTVDILTVTATSQIDTTVAASVVNTTTVEDGPPPPLMYFIFLPVVVQEE